MQRRSVIPDSEEVSERKERRRSTGRKISVVLLVAIIIIAAFILISQINRGESCPEGERKENGECVKQPEAPAPITTPPAETSTLISEPGSDEALRDAQPSSSAALP